MADFNAPTVTPPDVDTDIDWVSWLDLNDDAFHIECCAKPRFLCGAEYHPESGTLDASEDACEACLDRIDEGRCPRYRPTHFHCPLIEAETGLVTVCKGPKHRK